MRSLIKHLSNILEKRMQDSTGTYWAKNLTWIF
jgi:hypothetical protein